MKHELSDHEARVIGCLLEKQVTTPDQYPLSLNALTSACNQKSNREPLLSLAEADVQAIVDGLVRKSLVMEKSGFGSRVPKYQQRFCNLEFSELQFTAQELAIVCELLVRGPQTPGELRTRAARMAEFADVAAVEAALAALAARPRPLARQLAREPGRRDARWTQLFTGAVADPGMPDPAHTTAATAAPGHAPQAPPAVAATVMDRLERLEHEVRELRGMLEALRDMLATQGQQ